MFLMLCRSSIVESTLLEAKKQGKNFSVVVVDSRPLLEGETTSTAARSKRLTLR
jgi:translation initiation factor eIF-2B subunit delta